MSGHLSTVQVRHFSARTLSAPEMSALAEHLASCGSCQELFHSTRRAAVVPLSFTLAPEALFKHEHLQYEQLATYLGNGLDSEEREILELHLRGCESCREDVRSLHEFRRQIAPEMGVSYAPAEQVSERKIIRPALGWFGWRLKPVYAAAFIVALIAVALVATLSFIDRRVDVQQARVIQPTSERDAASQAQNPADVPQVTANNGIATPANLAQANSNTDNLTPEPTKSPRLTPSQAQARTPKQLVTKTPLTPASTVAELNDGDQKFTIDTAGNVTGLDRLTQNDRQAVRETLLAQSITKPTELAELVGQRGALRGSPADGQSFRLLSPARTVTASDRPTFKWEAMPGATSYRVYVGDADNRAVVSSAELSSSITEWTPSTSLPRGKVYTWAVIAKVNGNDIIAPAADQPEMKFKVLSADALQELTTLQASARSHLVMGLFYARVGMVEEAERELRTLARQNPVSPITLKLLRSVQSWR
jgi:hypothetical protein